MNIWEHIITVSVTVTVYELLHYQFRIPTTVMNSSDKASAMCHLCPEIGFH